MGTTTEYFRKKRAWSFLKDELLGWYLPPYLAKLAQRGQDIYIVDCFAGKGRFDDGNEGSPLIIVNAVEAALRRRPNVKIRPIFIEKKYSNELRKNLANCRYCEVIDGKFEDQFHHLKKICERATVLLYIDPYGIKSLDSMFFRELVGISQGAGTSFEMLLNLNAFGFLREGCRLTKPSMDLSELDDNDAVYEDEIESKEKMNRIAGGSYWEDLVVRYYKHEISFAQLENRFTSIYLQHLSRNMGWDGFTYVFETPIRDKSKNIPKYRMIFGTNHVDGAILMADNMSRRWNEFLERERRGQTLLFDVLATADGKVFTAEDVDEIIKGLVQDGSSVRIEKALVSVWEEFGVSISKSQIEKRIRHLTRNGEIQIIWEPPITRTGKRPRSLDFKRFKRIVLAKGCGKVAHPSKRKEGSQLSLFD